MGEVQAVARGCGTRKAGGIYAECGLSEDGMPLEYFLCDPPIVVPGGLDIAPQGVTLIERDGVTHIIDYVGSNHYPNVADFVEEVRRFGMSRRLPKTVDFGRLAPGSKIMLIHARAHIENPQHYRPPLAEDSGCEYDCPRDHFHHKQGHVNGEPGMCAGIWWEDIEGGDPGDTTSTSRGVVRGMPSFEYLGQRRPDTARPEYRSAFFLVLPVENLAVVKDPIGARHIEAEEKAARSGFTVRLCDE